MSKFMELFGTEKPIIALLHVRELPGDPNYASDLETVVKQAREELNALQDGGVDAILFSNEFSLPYIDPIEHVTSAGLAYVIGRLKDEIRIPYGIHAIGDSIATIDIATAVGASFVRGVFSGAYAGESGISNKNLGKVIRRRYELRREDLLMFYMINAESSTDLSGRDLGLTAKALKFALQSVSAPAGMAIAGIHAGQEADDKLIEDVKKVVPDVPVMFNTGCKRENIQRKLKKSDGAFVGTAFKVDGKFENFVDPQRVIEFMAEARKGR